MLQSAKFAAHAASWQPLATHLPVALSGAYTVLQLSPFTPQPPQFATLVLVLVSQSVPFWSQSAHGAVHTLTLHTWLTHLALALPIVQIVPQPPQLPASLPMFVSQPLATLPSQSAQPASHLPTLHADATHEGVACGTTQAEPQPPQLSTLVVVSVGQVPSAFGSQSPSPGRQLLTPHNPFVHVAEPSVVSHTLPHVPQLLTSALVFFSQPLTVLASQSEKPAVQVIWQAEATHEGVPLVLGQTLPHVVQLLASMLVLTSQPLVGSPSQSAKGGVHVPTMQAPPLQVEVACGKLHGVSHAPQWSESVFRFVSQPFVASPSQLPLPSKQVREQVPLVHAPPAQSVGSLHFWPGRQVEHEPPQSTSLSSPF
jgi:hypothetical protein